MEAEDLGRAVEANLYELRRRVGQLMRACNQFRSGGNFRTVEDAAVAIAESALNTVALYECCESGIPINFE